jgi:hypothetical protein
MNSTWPGKCDWLSERRLAWLLLHYWERNLNTNDWNDFLAAIIFIALSAASGEIASGIYFFFFAAYLSGQGESSRCFLLLSHTHIAKCYAVSIHVSFSKLAFISSEGCGFPSSVCQNVCYKGDSVCKLYCARGAIQE